MKCPSPVDIEYVGLFILFMELYFMMKFAISGINPAGLGKVFTFLDSPSLYMAWLKYSYIERFNF